MPSFRAVFGLNNRKSEVNRRHLRFCPFPKNAEMCRASVRIIHLTMAPTRHISELKYTPTHFTFPKILEIDKTALKDHQYLTSSDVIAGSFFLRRISETSQPSIILKPSSIQR